MRRRLPTPKYGFSPCRGRPLYIRAAISVGFDWLVFHGHDHVPSSGPGGLVRDAAPQTFIITLMSTLVPSLVTRKRMRSGHLDTWLRGQPGGSPAPASKIFLR